jgi:hypothetical protein
MSGTLVGEQLGPPHNKGLLQPGPRTPLFSLAWRVRR